MEPIESLLDKYWKGETSLEEEALIKAHYQKKSSNDLESSYFDGVEKRKAMQYRGQAPGFKVSFNRRWFSLAATVLIGILVGIISLQQSQNDDPFLIEDPQKALEVTKNAFQMISNNLDEGRKYSKKINKINTSKQVLENGKN